MWKFKILQLWHFVKNLTCQPQSAWFMGLSIWAVSWLNKLSFFLCKKVCISTRRKCSGGEQNCFLMLTYLIKGRVRNPNTGCRSNAKHAEMAINLCYLNVTTYWVTANMKFQQNDREHANTEDWVFFHFKFSSPNK